MPAGSPRHAQVPAIVLVWAREAPARVGEVLNRLLRKHGAIAGMMQAGAQASAAA